MALSQDSFSLSFSSLSFSFSLSFFFFLSLSQVSQLCKCHPFRGRLEGGNRKENKGFLKNEMKGRTSSYVRFRLDREVMGDILNAFFEKEE